METTYHTTKQCEEVASHKYSVDDGDSEMLLCGGCFRSCLTKKNKGSSWLGFFDCSYPPDAKVKGSRWYFWTLSNSSSADDEDEGEEKEEDDEEEKQEEEEKEEKQKEEKQEEKEEKQEEKEEKQKEEELCEKMAKCSLSQEDTKSLVAYQINARIASLQALVKASRNMPVKEQAKVLKEIINLRTELKKNK
jgi:flagellar biosynthesis GTPase FlhF